MRNQFNSAAIERREHRLPPSDGRDVPLGIQEVAPADRQAHETPVVLLHGATFGSAMFDISVPGYSLQQFLASQGWRSFALDVRGYGRSVPATVLDRQPEDNEPYAQLGQAIEDLAASVEFILQNAGSDTAHLVGFSWGTVIAAEFAARNREIVEKLVLYAPLYGEKNQLWIDRIADPGDPTRVNPGLGAYRWIGEADIRARWDADIPAGRSADDYREERVLREIVDTLARADPRSAERDGKSFRAPTGALVDLFEIFNGRPLVDPASVNVPALIIRGMDDNTSTHSDAFALFAALGTADKRYITISPGTHFLCAERNARELFSEIDLFLGT